MLKDVGILKSTRTNVLARLVRPRRHRVYLIRNTAVHGTGPEPWTSPEPCDISAKRDIPVKGVRSTEHRTSARYCAPVAERTGDN